MNVEPQHLLDGKNDKSRYVFPFNWYCISFSFNISVAFQTGRVSDGAQVSW